MKGSGLAAKRRLGNIMDMGMNCGPGYRKLGRMFALSMIAFLYNYGTDSSGAVVYILDLRRNIIRYSLHSFRHVPCRDNEWFTKDVASDDGGQ